MVFGVGKKTEIPQSTQWAANLIVALPGPLRIITENQPRSETMGTYGSKPTEKCSMSKTSDQEQKEGKNQHQGGENLAETFVGEMAVVQTTQDDSKQSRRNRVSLGSDYEVR